MTVFNNVLYFTKGSGSNGVNTVYFVDTTGKACPSGTGVPATNAALPSKALAYDSATVQTNGLPNNMCVLAGFPSTNADFLIQCQSGNVVQEFARAASDGKQLYALVPVPTQ